MSSTITVAMNPAVLAVIAAAGVHLVVTATMRSEGTGPDGSAVAVIRRRTEEWMVQAGLGELHIGNVAAVTAVLLVVVTVSVVAVFGALVPALAAGVFAASAPMASHRARRADRRARAQDAWPRMLEEMRIHTGARGRSIPQALFDVGRRAPAEMRPAFDAAHREWLMSTDFERTVAVLKGGLADPTADATCETLLVAHGVGGSEVDRRLEALIDDRIQDTRGRKDARAKQAGARFARRFVLFVPIGMAAAGMSVGNGRAAFATSGGQTMTLVALTIVVICWVWAGRILRIPEEARVFQG